MCADKGHFDLWVSVLRTVRNGRSDVCCQRALRQRDVYNNAYHTKVGVICADKGHFDFSHGIIFSIEK